MEHTNRVRKCAHVLAMAAGLCTTCSTTLADPLIQQPTPLINEHVDLNIFYTGGGAWDVRPYDGDFGGFALPGNESLLHVDRRSLLTVPASGFEFIGVEGSEQTYVLPQGQHPELLYLGFAGYGATPTSQWDRYNPSTESGGRVSGYGRWLKVALDSVKGPGELSVWQSGDTGPTVFMSTASGGITADDALWIVANGHTHYNFSFTKRGLYQVNLLPSGYLGDDGLTTPSTAGYSQAATAIAIYLNVDPGYATSGLSLSSTLTPRGATTANTSGFSQVVLDEHPTDGAVSVSNVDTDSPVFVLLDLSDDPKLGALVVALSGTSSYSPGNPMYLSEVYFLDDVPATATIDNSLLPSHEGYNLGLRFDTIPGNAFQFEFDYSMILDGVGIDRVGVVATAAVSCPADIDGSGSLDIFDVLTYLRQYDAGDANADLDGSGDLDSSDVHDYLQQIDNGCP